VVIAFDGRSCDRKSDGATTTWAGEDGAAKPATTATGPITHLPNCRSSS
jgi:hypothetical protein